MNLFTSRPADNLLPYDGIVNDYGVIFTPQQADDYFAYVEEHIAWRHDEAVIYGKHITTARQVAWYGEQNAEIRLQTQTNAGKTRNHAATRTAHRDARQHAKPLAARHHEKQQNPNPAHQPDLPHHAAAGLGFWFTDGVFRQPEKYRYRLKTAHALRKQHSGSLKPAAVIPAQAGILVEFEQRIVFKQLPNIH